LELGRLHHARVAEFLHQRRTHLVEIERRQSRSLLGSAWPPAGRRPAGGFTAARGLGALGFLLGGFLGFLVLAFGLRLHRLFLLLRVCHRSLSRVVVRGPMTLVVGDRAGENSLAFFRLRKGLAARARDSLARAVRQHPYADPRPAAGLRVV